jgi:hypothetical protein
MDLWSCPIDSSDCVSEQLSLVHNTIVDDKKDTVLHIKEDRSIGVHCKELCGEQILEHHSTVAGMYLEAKGNRVSSKISSQG